MPSLEQRLWVAVIAWVILCGLVLAQPGVQVPQADGLRNRLAERLERLDRSCVFEMRQTRIARRLETGAIPVGDEVLSVLLSHARAAEGPDPERLAEMQSLSEMLLQASSLPPDWERTEQIVRITYAPGLVHQSSRRGEQDHYDFLAAGVWISSSWDNGQVTIHADGRGLVRYGPSYLLAPLGTGKLHADWFRAQSWLPSGSSPGVNWMRLDFPDAKGAFELVCVTSNPLVFRQVAILYEPGDIVAAFLEPPDEHGASGPLPARHLRVSVGPRLVEVLEAVVSGWRADPADDEFLVPVPDSWRLVDERAGAKPVQAFGPDAQGWPEEIRRYLRRGSIGAADKDR